MEVVLAVISVPAAIIGYFVLKNIIRRHKKTKLRDSHIKITAHMVNYVWPTLIGSYYLRMVYTHPKDNKKRECLTEPIMRDVLNKGEVSMDYDYDIYVHPLDPK